MMNSSPKSQKRKILIALFILFVLSVGVIMFANSRVISWAQGAVQSIFSSPKSILYSIGKKETDNKVNVLTKRNLELERKLSDYELLKKDNDALKSQFDISGATSQNLIAASIIGFQGNSKKPSELIINVGKKDNIKIGMTVIFEKYLVGKISEASQNFSVVTTPLDQNFRVLAKLPKTNASGLLVGRGDFMLLDGVLITDTLEKDGVIVTKGEVDSHGVGVVPDIIIGKITSISKNETAPFQSAEVTLLINYSKLTDVFVIGQM